MQSRKSEGVHTQGSKWVAIIGIGKKQHHLGTFLTEDEAITARTKAVQAREHSERRLCAACGQPFSPRTSQRHCGNCGHRACSHCNQVKPLNEFTRDMSRGCNDCVRDYRRRQNRESGLTRTIYMKAWRKKNRHKIATNNALRRVRLLRDSDPKASTKHRLTIYDDPCFYCDGPGEHFDHFFPLAKGGTDRPGNLVRACAPCNLRKHTHCGTWFILMSSHVRAGDGLGRVVPTSR